MSEHIPARLRRLVIKRAKGRCEYCGLAQAGQEATFHVDHVIPKNAGGLTIGGNLAWACVSCSLRKEWRRWEADPETGQMASLFHPRNQDWADHFRWDGVVVVGLSPTGRATVAALQLNRPSILAIRLEEVERGRHPPPKRIRRRR
jgi:hypothetical protein